MKRNNKLNRREFLRLAGLGAGTVLVAASGCDSKTTTITKLVTETATQTENATATVIIPAVTAVTPASSAPITITPLAVTTITPTRTVAPVTATPPNSSNPAEISLSASGYTEYGDWWAEAHVTPAAWTPGITLNISSTLRVTEAHLTALFNARRQADGLCLLVTADRTFDADGRFRQASDEKMSTLLTPTRLAIEGGIVGAATNRFGYGFRTPVDEYLVKPLAALGPAVDGVFEVDFNFSPKLPGDLPPGIYRLRFDFGITQKNSRYSLNGENFAIRPFFKGKPVESHLYLPPVVSSGKHVSGRQVDGSTIKPRIPWVLLRAYNSNGYQGVIADEDLGYFALSQRNIIHDDVILPRFSADNKTVMSYNLEPQFPADIIEARSNIPWDYNSGELSIQVTGPDGKTNDLGTAPFAGQSGQWPTTKKPAFTSWKPPAYGAYAVTARGWIADIWGNRYQGGGTYRFWIAKRMTMATATFQGFAYPVGSKYGRDIGFAPAVPAEVNITATLYPSSDPAKAKNVSFSGKASQGGIYGSAQGAQQLALDEPGEYHAKILARYTDQEGHLWVCSMRHAGVVYATDSHIIARGKKLTIGDKTVDRGETHFEGWVESPEVSHLHHINYPFVSGDALLIASDQQGANKIEPVLTYETKTNPAPYDRGLQTIGATNLKLKTSNGYSPHMFPEYITEWAYYYAGAPRPGFMSRFLVGEDGVRAPYWPTSPNSFGSQVNTTSNGDLPGDIYRLTGGVVLRKKGEAPAYAGYLSSAFILYRYSTNNRVIAAGSEDLTGATGGRARFFLVGVRPGMVYEVGTQFVPVAQIDPVLPVNMKASLTYPDGRVVSVEGTGDTFGGFAGKDRWPMDMPGVYRLWMEGEWQGYRGYMPGLPQGGGYIFVVEKEHPVDVPRIKLELPEQSSFLAESGVLIKGTTSANEVYWAAVMPGAVLGQGVLTVSGGRFQYLFEPAVVHSKAMTYETTNLVTGRSQIGDVVQLTFFTREKASNGSAWHSFTRLIIRGTTVIYAY